MVQASHPDLDVAGHAVEGRAGQAARRRIGRRRDRRRGLTRSRWLHRHAPRLGEPCGPARGARTGRRHPAQALTTACSDRLALRRTASPCTASTPPGSASLAPPRLASAGRTPRRPGPTNALPCQVSGRHDSRRRGQRPRLTRRAVDQRDAGGMDRQRQHVADRLGHHGQRSTVGARRQRAVRDPPSGLVMVVHQRAAGREGGGHRLLPRHHRRRQRRREAGAASGKATMPWNVIGNGPPSGRTASASCTSWRSQRNSTA